MDSLMWIPATRAQHNRDALRFATDLTDEAFALSFESDSNEP